MSAQDPRLAERISSVHQLSGVVAAMRGIAAARGMQSRRLLEGVTAYADIVGAGIAQALALAPGPAAAGPAVPRRTACVLFCSEQGFVGAFNDHLCDAALPLLKPGSSIYVIGSRGARLLAARGHPADWSAPMMAQAGGVRRLADSITRTLIDALQSHRIDSAELIHARLDGPRIVTVRDSLLPLDTQRFRAAASGSPPLTYLPLPDLIRGLAGEYLFAQLAAAILQSHAAENQARLQAMTAAQENIARQLERLQLDQQIQRQDQITDELIELAAGIL
ncbi:MAG: F-type H+-transporting ATPase subunit gamma [Hydrocarboniphaga sp.]|uniref:F0F1 ATP synthase subunit gamma n=1 Tax=Hydrocarboniphaga sp. TaxID=2033016 RepID=UPI00260CC384|nr:FoF1 ATP synthase subunit gamma [Hydrocarboniphaga sp.]MDB5972268.1 F-type H+-transporting ATPase subunit gamma [Hydrocarboniphaga sp.]